MQNTDKNKKNKKTKNGTTSALLYGYEAFEKKIYDSASYKAFRKIKKLLAPLTALKRMFAGSCENSRLLSFAVKSFEKLLEKDLRYYGIGMFFFGIFVMAFSSLLQVSRYGADVFGREAVFHALLPGVIAVIFSVLLMSSHKSLSESFCDSRIMSFLLFDIFCFDRKRLERISAKTKSHTLPVIVGMLLSIPAVIFSSAIIVKLFTALILAYLILKSPENGVILVFLIIPFATGSILFGIVCFVCLSYLLKVFRNKRVFKLGLFDMPVIFFGLTVLLCGIISIKDTGSLGYSAAMLFVILFGFVISNTVKSTMLAEKCINAVILSATLSAAAGVVVYIINIYGLPFHSFAVSVLSDLIKSIPFGEQRLFSELIPLTIPFVLVKISRYSDAGKRLRGFVSLVILTAFSVLTLDASVWFTAFAAVLVYFCIINRKLIIYTVVAVVVGVILFEFVPAASESLRSFVYSFTDFAAVRELEHSASVYVSDVVSRFGLMGVGSSDAAAERVLTCIFGNAAAEAYPGCVFILKLLVKYGIIGLLSAVSVYVTSFMHNVGFHYSDKAYSGTVKLYSVACAASVSAIAAKGIFFPAFMTYEAVLLVFMIMYIGISLKKSAAREYVPDLFDLPAAV